MIACLGDDVFGDDPTVTALEAEVKALRMHPSAPVHTGVYALHGAEQNDLSPEDLKSERWNIYMPRWLRRLIEAEDAIRRRFGLARLLALAERQLVG